MRKILLVLATIGFTVLLSLTSSADDRSPAVDDFIVGQTSSATSVPGCGPTITADGTGDGNGSSAGGFNLDSAEGAAERRAEENACEDAEQDAKSKLDDCPEGCMGICLLYTSPSPRDRQKSRMPSSA